MRAERRIDRMENIAVRAVDITEAWQESGRDYVTVHFLASMLDYTIDERTNDVIKGSRSEAVKFEEYRTKVGPMMAKHGARYLTKGGSHKMPEGGHWKPERVVVIEFPDMNSLNAWYNSPEYKPLIALRKQCTSDQDMLFVLEGA